MNANDIEKQLKSDNVHEVINALRFLATRNEMRDLSSAISLIRHENVLVKQEAVTASVAIIRSSIVLNYHQLTSDSRLKLGELIDRIQPDIVHELISEVQSNNEQNRIQSLMILGLLRRRETIQLLIERELKSANAKVRATAVRAMGNQTAANEQLVLLKQLNDSDGRVRANAIESLAEQGNPKLHFSLKRLTNDGNNRVRANAIKALYQMGHHKIDSDIITMLQSKSSAMVASGLWLIGELGICTAEIKELCRLYRSNSDPMIQRNYQRAIARFTDL